MNASKALQSILAMIAIAALLAGCSEAPQATGSTAAARKDSHADFHLHELEFASCRETHITSERELMSPSTGKTLKLRDGRLG